MQFSDTDRSPLKRKRSGSDDGFDYDASVSQYVDEEGADEDYMEEPAKPGSQVLPVAALPDDFAGDPQDGLEYLFTVRRDAARLPVYTKVVNPYLSVSSTSKMEPSPTPAVVAEHPAIPSAKWRESFEARFEALRAVVAKRMDSLTGPQVLIPVPHYKDRDGWWKYINGDLKEADGSSAPSLSKQAMAAKSSDLSLEEPQEEGESEDEGEGDEAVDDEGGVVVQMTTIIDDEEPVAGASKANGVGPAAPAVTRPTPGERNSKPPTTQIITQLDNRAAFQLLMFFGYWITLRLADKATPIGPTALPENDSKWIFSLLARLEKQLSSEQISTLRVLARGCVSLLVESLKTPSGDGTKQAGCWMVIAAVSKGWGQADLWNEAISTVTRAGLP